MKRTAIVVGGGVSGLAAAWYLDQRGIDATVVEKSPVLAGRMGLDDRFGADIHFGGKNIGKKYTEFRRFCETFSDVEYEYFGVNTSRVEDGKLVTVDYKKPWKALPNIVLKNNPRDVLRFASMARRVRQTEPDRWADSTHFNQLAHRHGDKPVDALFGRSFLRNVVRPMVVRMNGAEVNEAAIATFGSNLGVLLDSYEQLVKGIRPVLDGFSNQFSVHTNTEVTELLFDEGQRVRGVVTTNKAGRENEQAADLVVLALPAIQSAQLLRPRLPMVANVLDAVRYNPVGVVIAEYEADVFSPQVRAVVFDEQYPLSNAGAYGIGELNKVRYTFSGLAARKLLAQKPNEIELVERAEEALSSVIKFDRSSRRSTITRIFEPGLCAMTLNQKKFIQDLDRELGSVPGLQLTGDYIKGASIEACFRSSSERVAQYFNAIPTQEELL